MSEPDLGPRRPGPAGPPRLDRAPGERYASRGTGSALGADTAAAGVTASPGPPAGRRAPVRALLAAAAVALAGVLLFFALGLVDVGPGTLAAAAAVGWAVALAVIRDGEGAGLPGRGARMSVAGGLAAAAVILGLLLGWAWSRSEGGSLPPLEYLDQRYGALAWVDVLVAAIAAAWRAR